eukprot:gene10199-biopygen373
MSNTELIRLVGQPDCSKSNTDRSGINIRPPAGRHADMSAPRKLLQAGAALFLPDQPKGDESTCRQRQLPRSARDVMLQGATDCLVQNAAECCRMLPNAAQCCAMLHNAGRSLWRPQRRRGERGTVRRERVA